MQAIQYDDYGGPDVLQLREIDKPRPDHSEVLIRVSAASLNPIDWRIRSGEMRYLLPGGFPRTPGFDVAGTIESAPGESDFKPGDRVMAFLDNMLGGGYAEYATCSPDVIATIPSTMSFEDAAAIPLAATTALQSLFQHGHLKRGQHVIITGASGGVGTFAVQIAKAAGATVSAVASGKNRELVESLGADQFIDYKTQKIAEVANPCDVFFDAAGKCSFKEMHDVIHDHGRFISTEPNFSGIALSLITKVLPGQRFRVMLAKGNHTDLGKMVRLYSDGLVRIIRNETFDLAQAAAAHRHGEAGNGVGKIVLRMQ